MVAKKDVLLRRTNIQKKLKERKKERKKVRKKERNKKRKVNQALTLEGEQNNCWPIKVMNI